MKQGPTVIIGQKQPSITSKCSSLTPAFSISLSSDPKFLNVDAKDFRLQSDSPAIDTGVNVGISWDINGYMRPQGGGYDIGAYEYQFNKGVEALVPPMDLKIVSVD